MKPIRIVAGVKLPKLFKAQIHKPVPLRGFWADRKDPNHESREAKVASAFRRQAALTPEEEAARRAYLRDHVERLEIAEREMDEIKAGWSEKPFGARKHVEQLRWAEPFAPTGAETPAW